jgi:hypothetical protein
MDLLFKFHFTASAGFPLLAWCLELEDGSNIARVVHGEWVETSDRNFSEGSWAGDFARARFDDAYMTGTGAMLGNDTLIFVTPSHTLDRLNVLRKGQKLYVSNSLPCILAHSGEELDTDFLFYDGYVASIRHGLARYERRIFTKSKLPVTFFYCCNIVLGRDHKLVEVPKRPTVPFASYDAYKSHLSETIQAIAKNASDARRKIAYTPLATVSRGYDSPAAMVLAMDAGCKQAIAFRDSRGTVGDEDCGTAIANTLGLSVREFGRLDYRQFDDYPEIRSSGGPSEFLSFGDYLQGRLLFTGFNGDMIWDRNSEKVSANLIRTDASGAGLTEFRLGTGFCHLPVPFIGADRHPSIHAISNSPEMAQWTLGTSYDRPIARRIVEEAGIPRQMFGQKKRASGVVVTSEGLEATMSERALLDFERFISDKWSAGKSLKAFFLVIIKRFVHFNERATKASARIGRVLGLRFVRVPNLLPHRLTMLTFGYLGQESLLFHWGVEKLVARYKAALSSNSCGRISL